MYLMKRLSIQSKLVTMLLFVAIASIATVGWIAYSSGKDALRAAALNHLTSVRASKKVQIEAFFKTLQNQVSNLADDRMMIAAVEELTAGFDEFKNKEIKPEWDKKILAFYQNDFLPRLEKGTGTKPRPELFLPTTPEARYAQYLYIANNPNPAMERFEYKDARDGSKFSAAHARYHDIFSKFIQDFHYDNLILIDQAGDIVYTFSKTPLFGTNLLTGPYSNGNTAKLFHTLRKTSSISDVKVEDFSHSTSSAGKPIGLLGAALFDGAKQVGVMCLQVPVDEINRVMTDNFGWVQDGLGKTGEIFLVGSDMLMRSRSRLLYENAPEFFKELDRAKYPPEDIARVHRYGTATLAQPVRTRAVELAASGRTGTAISQNYRGVEVLTAYAPLYVFGLHWSIVAEIESAEAFAPLTDLTRKIFIASLTTILVVTVLASFLGRHFVRPILKLVDGIRRLESGEKHVSIEVESADEFADLGDAFNLMSNALVYTGEQLESITKHRDELLENILPAGPARRMRNAQPAVADEFADISIVYINLIPFDEATSAATAEQALGIQIEFVSALDEAAATRGVEKLSCNGSTYVACCDIAASQADHAVRAVEFAQDVLRITERLYRDRSAKLRVQIGIDSGPAAGGVVGRTHYTYLLAGETMSIASLLAGQAPADALLVGRQVYEAVNGVFHFGHPTQIFPPGGGHPTVAWQLKATEPIAAPVTRTFQAQSAAGV